MPDIRAKGPGGLNLLTASELSQQVGDGRTSSVEIVEACLARIAARDPGIHAWVHLDAELALRQARECDRQPRRSPLHGIPVGIKDIFDTHDMPTAYGAAAFRGYRPAADTALVALMRRAGMVILGKCTTTELASPVPAGVRNPHDPERTPGVSSSGSAAAVADYMVPLTLGSQTGGSTILPASFCGIVGYKASLTGLDRGGVRNLRPTLDSMGLFARSAADIALFRSVLSGCLPDAPPADLKGARLAICRTMHWHQAEPGTADALARAGKRLAQSGAQVFELDLPAIFDGLDETFRVISNVEQARALGAETPERLATLNPWIRDSLAGAAGTAPSRYDEAQLHAIRCQRALADIFRTCDAIVTPSVCGEAPRDLVSVSNSVFNRMWTLMHGPCVALPAGEGPDGMPVGLQVVGPTGSDGRLLALSQAIGRVLD